MITKYFGASGRVTRVHTGPEGDLQFSALAATLIEYPDERGDLATWPAVLKSLMRQKIKAERDRRKANGGFLVGTLWFRSDAESLALYGQMLTMAVEQALLPTYVFRTAWRSMSGATTPMTVALVRQIRDAGFVTWGLIDDTAQSHIVAVGLSATPESYNYSTGWPPTYN